VQTEVYSSVHHIALFPSSFPLFASSEPQPSAPSLLKIRPPKAFRSVTYAPTHFFLKICISGSASSTALHANSQDTNTRQKSSLSSFCWTAVNTGSEELTSMWSGHVSRVREDSELDACSWELKVADNTGRREPLISAWLDRSVYRALDGLCVSITSTFPKIGWMCRRACKDIKTSRARCGCESAPANEKT